MSWTEPKIGDKFRVCVFIVDDTYWDDGNRTTSRDHDFAELSEAYKFLTEARKRGWYETTSWETRQKLRRHLNHDDFILYLHTAEGWRRIDDDEILTLLSLL